VAGDPATPDGREPATGHQPPTWQQPAAAASAPAARSLDVAPTPLRGSGGGRGRAAFVLGAMGLVLAGAVGVAQLTTRAAPRVAVATAGTDASHAVPAASPTPLNATAILDGTPARLHPAALAAAVRDGSLDNRLVFVDGDLRVESVDCDNLATVRLGCIQLTIPGLGLPVRAAEPRLAWMPVPLDAWLVTVARGRALVYLGSLVPDRQLPSSLRDLEQRLIDGPGHGTKDRRDGTLFETNGTLLTGAPPPCTGACPSERPTLAAPLLVGDGVGTETVVDVPANTPDVDLRAQWLGGPFLVTRGRAGAGWQVVARYVPSRAVRVQVP